MCIYFIFNVLDISKNEGVLCEVALGFSHVLLKEWFTQDPNIVKDVCKFIITSVIDMQKMQRFLVVLNRKYFICLDLKIFNKTSIFVQYFACWFFKKIL